jgi:BspA type Leucine rich repeat region (6 copies)
MDLKTPVNRILHSTYSMKTNCIQTYLLAVLLALPAAVQAQFTYITNNGVITITGYTGGGTVNIPATINGLPVTSIGGGGFQNSGLTSVTIPDSITNIGDYVFSGTHLSNVTIPGNVTQIGFGAFYDCYNLASVTLNNGVTSIEDQAFLECDKLASVTIPDSVTSIGNGAFEWCSSLPSVTIGNGIISIGDHAFDGCWSLTAITVAANNPAYRSVNGVLLNKDLTTLVTFPGGLGGNYTIPDGVTDIGRLAFFNCINLQNVTMPDSVTNIGDYAFDTCINLTSVIIPNGIIRIGDYAFANDDYPFSISSLTNVTIGNSVTSIGDFAFSGTSLMNALIPDSVTNIGDFAFSECFNLTAIRVAAQNPVYNSAGGVLFDKSQTTLILFPPGLGGSYTIPDGITNIGNDAFEDTALTSVTIPNSVTSIGDGAFEGTALTNVIIPNSVTDIESEAFENCENLMNVTIGNGVSSIGNGALSGTALTRVTIPASVTNISDYAFSGCYYLTNVYFNGDAPFVVPNRFLIDHQGDFYPDGSFANDDAIIYYLPDTVGWSNTFAGSDVFAGFPTALWLPQIQTGNASFGVRTNQFGFNIAWVSGQTVTVEACTDLANPVWQPVQTNTLAGDTVYFNDPQWTNYPARFYRLRSL